MKNYFPKVKLAEANGTSRCFPTKREIQGNQLKKQLFHGKIKESTPEEGLKRYERNMKEKKDKEVEISND